MNKITRKEAVSKVSRIILGVDFGGNGSGHAFVATGMSRDYKEVVSLVSEWHKAEGTDPEELADLFVDFVLKVINVYGMPEICYCDSAEQVLIEGLRKALEKANIPYIYAEENLTNISKKIGITISNIYTIKNLEYKACVICQLEMLYNHTINDTTQDYQINDFIGDLNKVYLATNRACDYLSIVTAFNEETSDIIKLLIESK